MTKKHSTKRALIASVLLIALCISTLVGTTFAWFTDSATSANNIIKSGNLDVGMYWAKGTEDPTGASWNDASKGAIFDYDNWEPGYVEVRHIKISNEGSLALKYKVNIVANGEVSKLADVIDVYYLDPAQQIADRNALTDANKIGNLTTVLAGLDESGNGTLLAGEADTITIALKMQENAGNEYQKKSIGASFSVQLLATQFTYENDSFDDQYDKDATYPDVGSTVIEENSTAATTIDAGNVSVTVPAGVSAGKYEVVVTNKNASTDAAGQTTYTADINLLKDGVKVERNGTTVYVVEIQLEADKNIVKVLHNGNEVSDFEYDPVTGIIKFETDSFSPFSVIYEPNKTVKVSSSEEFMNALAAAESGAIIDATGVTLVPVDNESSTIAIPAGVTVKGANFAPGGSCWLVIGEGEDAVAFEDCTFTGVPLDQFKITNKGCDEVTYTNCAFTGMIMINNTSNRDAVNTFNNCSFGLANGFMNCGYVNCMGANNIFNQCTFNYAGGSTMGSNQYLQWNAVNSYSENTNTLESHNFTTYVELNGCVRNGCGTHKNTANSTLIIK